jgi:hypothetical protein
MEAIDTIAAIHRLDWDAPVSAAAGAGTGDVHDRFLARHSDLLHWWNVATSRIRLRRIYDCWRQLSPLRPRAAGRAKLGNLMIDDARSSAR